MLRSGRHYRLSTYNVIVPDCYDSGDILESKWRKWLKEESFKRFVLNVDFRSVGTNSCPKTGFSHANTLLKRILNDWEQVASLLCRIVASTPSASAALVSKHGIRLEGDLPTSSPSWTNSEISTSRLSYGSVQNPASIESIRLRSSSVN